VLLRARVAELLALLDAGYCYRQLAWSDCPLVTTVSRAKTDETIEMPFGLWTRVQGQKTVCYVGVQIPEGAILGVVPSLKCIKLCKQQARGCRLIRRGQRITTKVRLQNGLTHRGGDKCRGDATLRQNSLTTCSLQRTSMCVCVCACVCVRAFSARPIPKYMGFKPMFPHPVPKPHPSPTTIELTATMKEQLR